MSTNSHIKSYFHPFQRKLRVIESEAGSNITQSYLKCVLTVISSLILCISTKMLSPRIPLIKTTTFYAIRLFTQTNQHAKFQVDISKCSRVIDQKLFQGHTPYGAPWCSSSIPSVFSLSPINL